MISMKEETESVLDKLYAEGVLYKKYRDVVGVCSFYEYFDSGRCSTFDGYAGAYHTDEHDTPMKLIIRKLNEVIEKMDEVKVD